MSWGASGFRSLRPKPYLARHDFSGDGLTGETYHCIFCAKMVWGQDSRAEGCGSSGELPGSWIQLSFQAWDLSKAPGFCGSSSATSGTLKRPQLSAQPIPLSEDTKWRKGKGLPKPHKLSSVTGPFAKKDTKESRPAAQVQ